jgi:TonB family protein
MSDAWKHWEGQVVDGKFPLRQYLGGSERSAVFLTDLSGQQSGKAAIKLVLIDPSNAELQLYRWKEAIKLSHPHLLRLFEVGRCHLDNMSLLYVVMEYADEDVSQILPQRPLTAEETTAMLELALNAMAYLHGRGLVHGHLKPSNIMAVEDQVKLSGDGVREIAESTAGMAQPTPYDPPEMPGGRALPASDMWSLGTTLVEVLTQRLPVWDESREDPALPETLPQTFVSIVRQCLRRDPAQRPTVQEVMDQLHMKAVPERSVAAVPVESSKKDAVKVAEKRADTYLAKPTQAPAAVQRRPVAKRRSAGPAVAAAVAVVALVGGWSLLRNRSQSLQTSSSALDQPAVLPAPSGGSGSASEAAPHPESLASPAGQARSKSDAAPVPASRQSSAQSESTPGERAGLLAHGAVVEQALPEVSRGARESIRGTLRVSVKVHVDPTGRVTDAELDAPGPSKYFAGQALKAARKWTFQPGKVDGASVPSEWTLQFEFRNTDTTVVPVESSP